MLQRLHSMCVERTSKGELVNLEDVKRRGLASKPAFATSLPDMWTFVIRYSRGTKANMMQETQQFVMTNTKSIQLGAPLWKALVEDSKIASNPLVRWRHAARLFPRAESIECEKVIQQGDGAQGVRSQCPHVGSQAAPQEL